MSADLHAAVLDHTERLDVVESHLSRIGALEKDSILAGAAAHRLSAEFADLRAHVYSFSGELRQALAEQKQMLKMLLEAR